MKKKNIISSEDLFDVLSNVRNELSRIKDLKYIRFNSALYVFIFNALFSVSSAINHLDDFEED